ncbi:MAG: ATP-binding protein [Eubacteriales bacterium]|nr:ATP-binding protein [Eubacteriales bacterium]
MEYIHREIERKVLKMSKVFKAVMVTGARQVGKTTMLRQLAHDENRSYVSMDDARNRELARNDPGLFFQMFKPPILIDEVQKAPELFEHIKMMCDETEETGLFWMTGSESRKLLKEAGDSLAGRICILKMYSLSAGEKQGVSDAGDLSFELDALKDREKLFQKKDIIDVFEYIWRGGMPGAQQFDAEELRQYYSSYIDTYLMRDAVDDNGITETESFRRALTACAAFTGHMLNYSDIAAAAGVSVPTARKWIDILQSMGIVFLLQPFSGNGLKRLIKTPKLYFCDTGLAAYLSMWTSRDVLMNGAAGGQFFENYVVGELVRSYAYGRKQANLTYYRDANQREIDVIIEDESGLHPIEIKKTAAPDSRIIRTFEILKAAGETCGAGGVICMSDRVFPIDRDNTMIPAWII